MTRTPTRADPRLRFTLSFAVFLAAGSATTVTLAAGGPGATHDGAGDALAEAGKHFQRGVDLYREGSYAAALVEFRRAYQLAPDYRVLYNIGRTHEQVRDYVAARATLEQYLGEGGAEVPKDRRAAVTADLARLATRIGTIMLTVTGEDAEIRLDDSRLGQAPFSQAIPVSAGRHRVALLRHGANLTDRELEVAGTDTVSLELQAPAEAPAPVAATTPAPAALPEHTGGPRTEAWVSWGVTAALAGAAGVTGIVTLDRKKTLDAELAKYPADPAAVDAARSGVRTFGTVSDVLLVSSALAAGVSLYFTLRHSSAKGAAVVAGPGAVHLRAIF